jgi:LacI family transcriptional regulator
VRGGSTVGRAYTIRDLARVAGVGVGTASRVLNDSPHVSDATRARVRAVAERLGYQPSPIARAFSRGRSQTLEIVIPLFTRHFYIEVLRGVEDAIVPTDYALLVRTVERRADRERLAREARPAGRTDGCLIISLRPGRALLERFAAAGQPVVLVDGEWPGLSSVAVDHEAAARAAVRHLVGRGHRRIALIDRHQDPFAPTRLGARQRGYRLALAEAGLAPRPGYERVADFSPEAAAAALAELLALPRPPTAVFVGSDGQAMGVLDGARARGLRVPQELAVVGYNDIELAPYLDLTTMHVPMRELGRRGAELLLRQLADPTAASRRLRLPVRLVVRGSSG